MARRAFGTWRKQSGDSQSQRSSRSTHTKRRSRRPLMVGPPHHRLHNGTDSGSSYLGRPRSKLLAGQGKAGTSMPGHDLDHQADDHASLRGDRRGSLLLDRRRRRHAVAHQVTWTGVAVATRHERSPFSVGGDEPVAGVPAAAADQDGSQGPRGQGRAERAERSEGSLEGGGASRLGSPRPHSNECGRRPLNFALAA